VSLFLTIFFLVYGGIHLYVFLKTKSALSLGIFASIVTATLIVFMILSPVIVRLAERAGHEDFARMLAYICYTWMGAILIFFVTNILFDIIKLILYGSATLWNKDFSYAISAHRLYFFTCLTTTLLVVIYGVIEARQIKIEHLIIPTNKISADIGKVRIVQISDVHLGLIIGEERIKRIVNAIQTAKPDILVSTGDLVDVQLDNIDGLAGLFHEVDTQYGKFAVTGNHEFYVGLERSLEFTRKAGFKILREEAAIIPGIITIAGVDDEAVRGWHKGENKSEQDLCLHIDNSQYTVLLKHRPVPYTGSLCVYDLQLSGHTHKGQIFPFYLITRLFFNQYAGFYRLNRHPAVYVRSGTGTLGPLIHFLVPPEVTIIDIVRSNVN